MKNIVEKIWTGRERSPIDFYLFCLSFFSMTIFYDCFVFLSFLMTRIYFLNWGFLFLYGFPWAVFTNCNHIKSKNLQTKTCAKSRHEQTWSCTGMIPTKDIWPAHARRISLQRKVNIISVIYRLQTYLQISIVYKHAGW